VAAGAFFFLWRPRRRSQSNAAPGNHHSSYASIPHGNSAGEGTSYDGTYYDPKRDGDAAPQYETAEMESNSIVREMPADTNRTVAELPAQSPKPGELYG